MSLGDGLGSQSALCVNNSSAMERARMQKAWPLLRMARRGGAAFESARRSAVIIGVASCKDCCAQSLSDSHLPERSVGHEEKLAWSYVKNRAPQHPRYRSTVVGTEVLEYRMAPAPPCTVGP